ncbi:MAG: hypothetical protein AAGA42_07520 [Actinomycetota bacterium]
MTQSPMAETPPESQPAGIGGRSMADTTIGLGGALIVVGVGITIASSSGSATSLIPAFVGVVFVALGVAARAKPSLHHHLMHASAALALLAALGSVGSAIGRGSTGWALVAQLATIILCGGYVFLAVQSFRAARKAREAAA